MRKFSHLFILFYFIQTLQINHASAQASLPADFPKFEITADNSPSDGYFFIAPMTSANSYGYIAIIDRLGTPVYYRYAGNFVSSFKLQPNAFLSYTIKNQDFVCHYIMDSSFVVTDFVKAINYQTDNSDFIAMQNGHFLLLANETRTIDLSAVINGGKVNALVSACVIQELDQNKNIIFEWKGFDHFEITDTYSDLTASEIDLTDATSIDIDTDGNLLLMCRFMDEMTKINKQTGEIIWRMGGKKNQFTFNDPSIRFSGASCARRLTNGNIGLYDNGYYRENKYSRALEYTVDEINKTVSLAWNYDAKEKIYSAESGSAQKLINGNTVIGYGNDTNKPALLELHPDSSLAFGLNFPIGTGSNTAFKFLWRTNLFVPNRYSITYPEWDGYTYADYILTIQNNSEHSISITSCSNHKDAFKIETILPLAIPVKGKVQIIVRYEPGYNETGVIEDILTINSDINSDTLVQRVSQQVKLFGSKPDITAPSAVISVVNNTNVPTDTILFVHFTEAIRKPDNSEFNYLNIDSLIIFRSDNSSGADVSFDAVFSTDKKLISILSKKELNPGQNYFIAIAGNYEDYYGNSGSEVSGIFKTESISLVNSLDERIIKIFPNPGNGLFQINFAGYNKMLVKLTDLQGNLLFLKQISDKLSHTLDLSNYANGMYILTLQNLDSNTSKSYKLIKR